MFFRHLVPLTFLLVTTVDLGSYGYLTQQRSGHYVPQSHVRHPSTSGKVKSPHRRTHSDIPNARPALDDRLFVSPTVEGVIDRVSSKIRDATLRQIFVNCFPSTLDTTVLYHAKDNDTFPYTYIITGDIHAMWLRDSTYQVNPYVKLAKDDPALRDLLLGVINTQAEMINIYPYGNAFYPLKHWNYTQKSPSSFSDDDQVFPEYNREEVFEAKYELDSLASFLYLSKHLWEETEETRFLNNPNWLLAVDRVLTTMRDQQGGTVEVMTQPPYKFTRPTRTQSETTNLYGIGNPVRRCGLIRSFFRPSDDSTVLQFLIPSNIMAVVGLEGVAQILDSVGVHQELSAELKLLATEVRSAIELYGIVSHPQFGKVFAFEVDGYGSHVFMDDGNYPSLLSLPFYNYVARDDPVYLATRRYILSPDFNTYFAQGRYPGVGSPHTGLQKPWHLAQTMQALTATNEQEIVNMLRILRSSTAGTGVMHESYEVNDPSQFSREWFAWANTFFGDLIIYIEANYPHLLDLEFE